jgi:cob(I)alamin adenosyltransferase
MKVYTKTGDKGSPFGGTRVPKDHARIESLEPLMNSTHT